MVAAQETASAEATRVAGVLQFNAERQTLTECGTGTIYWVRVLASNPHFSLAQRVEELSSALAPGQSIMADLEGEVSISPSGSPAYPIDKVLTVTAFHSVVPGQCE